VQKCLEFNPQFMRD